MTKRAVTFALGFVLILSLSFLLVFTTNFYKDNEKGLLGGEKKCPQGEQC